MHALAWQAAWGGYEDPRHPRLWGHSGLLLSLGRPSNHSLGLERSVGCRGCSSMSCLLASSVTAKSVLPQANSRMRSASATPCLCRGTGRGGGPDRPPVAMKILVSLVVCFPPVPTACRCTFLSIVCMVVCIYRHFTYCTMAQSCLVTHSLSFFLITILVSVIMFFLFTNSRVQILGLFATTGQLGRGRHCPCGNSWDDPRGEATPGCC